MKICSMVAEMFHVDKQTKVMKITVTFRNFAIVLKKTGNVNPFLSTLSVIFLQFAEHKLSLS
jgi:hypothetical protein